MTVEEKAFINAEVKVGDIISITTQPVDGHINWRIGRVSCINLSAITLVPHKNKKVLDMIEGQKEMIGERIFVPFSIIKEVGILMSKENETT